MSAPKPVPPRDYVWTQPTRLELVRFLHSAAASAFHAVHSNTMECRSIFDHLTAPEIGDIVFETSTSYRFQTDDNLRSGSIGYLREQHRRPKLGLVWFITPIVGRRRRVRWTNARFVRVPNNVRGLLQWLERARAGGES